MLNLQRHITGNLGENSVSTFVKTKVLTEFSNGTLGFSVGRIVKP